MSRTSTRLAAGTLALVLPLSAVAACGAEKKKTVKAEFESAQQHLADSKAASFTLRVDDSKDALAALMTEEEDGLSKEVAAAILGGSVTYVVDPVGDATLGESSSAALSPTDVAGALKKVNVAFVVKDDKGLLGEIRLVDGVLYAKVVYAEVKRLAELGGAEDVDAELDSAVADGPPELAQIVKDVKAGKWLKLDTTAFADQLKELSDGLVTGFGASPAPSAEPFDSEALGKRLYDAVKPYVTVTDANDSSKDRVLDVKVQARPALKAALKILAATDDLPFPNVFADIDPAEVDDNVKEGTAKGQIRLSDSHLKQVSVDIESIRVLSTDPGDKSVAGSSVVFDVDDSIDELKAPGDVSSVDLAELVQQFLDGFAGMVEGEQSSYAG